jgi:hypothetical protein
MRTGKFNVSKPTDMPDIPEEKSVSGSRPVSTVSQFKTDQKDKRGSATSTVSELSTSSTQVGSGLGIDLAKARGAAHTPQPGDLLFVPPDVKTPTTFGPNNEYTAVPSIVTYSSGRGMTRVTIREATADDPTPTGYDVPAYLEAPHYPEVPPPSVVPVIPPPPNFQPIRLPHDPPAPSTTPRSWQSSQPSVSTGVSRQSVGSESIRTSATSFQSIRTSTASKFDDEAVSEIGSHKTYVATPPGSPPQPSALPHTKYTGTPSSNASWPLPPHSRDGSSHKPSASSMHTGYQNSSRGSTAFTYNTLENPQSRFSWHVSNTDRARNWFTEWFVEWWLLEILSWCFSAICMIIIAVVLYKQDGKTMPKWRMGITINAFISIFSGFAKSALLLPTAEALGQLKWNWFRKGEKKMMDFEVMDSASRGAWGSMVMLARGKGV